MLHVVSADRATMPFIARYPEGKMVFGVVPNLANDQKCSYDNARKY